MPAFKLDNRKIPNGTVLVFGIRYDREDDERPANPTIYTYAMLKAGDAWYVTGSGKTPSAAGWGAVERWLARDGRVVVSVDVMGPPVRVWPKGAGPGPDGAGVPSKPLPTSPVLSGARKS